MALAPLATTADLSDRGISTGNLQTALAVASSLIRDAAGSAIDSQTADITVTGGRANLLTLPGPVTSVASVSIDSRALDADDYEILPNGLWRHCGWGTRPVPVEVVYTFGLATVPEDIVDLCCVLAKAWLDHVAAGGSSVAGLQSAGVDDAREAYTPEASGQLSPVFIPAATRDWLAQRFSGGPAVVETL